MSKKEIIYKIFRAVVLMGISLFFLFPFALPFKNSVINLFTHPPQPTNIITPVSKASEDPVDWDQKPVTYTSDNLGINLPWLDTHNGKAEINWLNKSYKSNLIENDLKTIQEMGITKIRSWCQMESVFNYKDGKFVLNEIYAKNLDDFLNRADKHGISVICVMADGNYKGESKDLDGNFHWDLIQTPEGLEIYKQAYIDYINHFKSHPNILMWDIHNEPYGSTNWSFAAKKLNVTTPQVHTYLLQSYKTIKPLAGNAMVGFSDLEEENQAIFKFFSSETMRKAYVDDSTDVYAMHIYRASPEQVADFRKLNNKPKWVIELGAYNYSDPDAVGHPIAAANELYNTDENYIAVTQISKKLLNSGFSLIMPWGFSANDGMVKHNPDGTHTLLRLAQFMKDQLLNYKAAHEETATTGGELKQ